MHLHRIAFTALFGLSLLGNPASAAINASKLGASYDAAKTSVTFKVSSSRASRIELFVYSSPTAATENGRFVMTSGTGGVWNASIPVATLATAELAL